MNGIVVSLDEYRRRKQLLQENRLLRTFNVENEELSLRIARVKGSLDRLNMLVKELREMENT